MKLSDRFARRAIFPAMSDTQTDLWGKARTLFGEGKSARQIAHVLDLPCATLNRRALDERWSAPPPPDWKALRLAWEEGAIDRILIARYGVSGSTLRKRREREGWQRGQSRGIDALRRAVNTLETVMDQADMSDTALITRLAAALSMAAGRLRDAEKLEAAGRRLNATDEPYGTEGEDEADREAMSAMLNKLAETEGAGAETVQTVCEANPA